MVRLASATPRYPVSPADIRTLLLRLTVAVFGSLVAFGLAEVGLRLAGPVGAAPLLPLSYDLAALDRIAAGDAYIAFDRQLGWITSPGIDRLGGDVQYLHNAAGLRADREYAPRPAVETRRILAFGDSFTYCEEVELEDCWTTLLEDELKRSEVLNFGVPGYAPDQAWLRYQQGAARLEPCAVLIGVMVENVNRVVNRFRPFYYPETGIPLPKPRYLLDHGELTLLPSPVERLDQLRDPAWVEANLGQHDDWYYPGLFVPTGFDQFETARLARTAGYRQSRRHGQEWSQGWAEQMYRPGSEPLELLAAILTEFAAQVRADGATPVVLVFPYLDEIQAARDERPKAHQALLDRLAAGEVPTLDLTDELGQQARRSSIGNLLVHHYRPLGNRVVARTVASRLPRLAAATCGR